MDRAHITIRRNSALTLTHMKSMPRLETIRKILVFRALSLGDLLCAVPALRSLRRWIPEARITYAGLAWSAAFASRFHRYIDEFVEFPGYPGLPERQPDIRAIPEFIVSLQEKEFDLALQMHGSGGISNPLVSLFGARVTAGFFEEGAFFPHNGIAVPYPDSLPEIRRCLALVESLGAPVDGAELEFPLEKNDFEELSAIDETARLPHQSYLVVHPGANAPTRRWTPEGFAAACDGISEGRFMTVITGSTAEREIAERVRAAMRFPAINLAGRTSLGALAALIHDSRLVLANDTGVSHIAAALRVPSVIIFTASDPARWKPLDTGLHAAIGGGSSCAPCELPLCPIGHPCARDIQPAAVIREGRRLMRQTGFSPAAIK